MKKKLEKTQHYIENRVKVEAAVNPSEDAQKVTDAIVNLFTRCSPEVSYRNRVVGRAEGSDPLAILYEQVRSRCCDGCAEEDAFGQSSRG